MTKLIRKLNNKLWMDNKFLLDLGGVPADALKSFSTKNCTLSVYKIFDDEISAERIAIAIAAGRDSIDHIDYAVFDISILSELNIVSEDCQGVTADVAVNNCHIDLKNFTVNKLTSFVEKVQETAECTRLTQAKVKKMLKMELDAGNLQIDRMKKDLVDRLDS